MWQFGGGTRSCEMGMPKALPFWSVIVNCWKCFFVSTHVAVRRVRHVLLNVGMFLIWKTTDPSNFICRLLCSFRNDIDCWWRKCIQAICLHLAIAIWYTTPYPTSMTKPKFQNVQMKYLFENLLPKTNWFNLRLPFFPLNHDCTLHYMRKPYCDKTPPYTQDYFLSIWVG